MKPDPTLLELVDLVDNPALRRELGQLKATVAAFERAQHVHTGDRAVIAESLAVLGDFHGWRAYREILVPGSVGVIQSMYWSEYHRSWLATWRPDVEWSVDSRWIRHRHSDHHQFSLPIRHLRPATPDDVGLPLPSELEGDE